MITTLTIKVSAAHPNMPLGPFATYVGSAVSATIVDVPRSLGNRSITGVYLVATNVAGISNSYAATRVGSAWGVTVPPSFFAASGTVQNGIKIQASGTDDNGDAVANWTLGAGDIDIMESDGSITPGESTHVLHWHDTRPESPVVGDVAPYDGSYYYYDGSAWVLFSASGNVNHADFDSLSELTTADSVGTMKTTINSLINILKGTSAALALMLAPFAASAEALYTTINDAPGDTQIMTNVADYVADAVTAAGSVTPEAVTNITTGVVTKSFVEGLGVSVEVDDSLLPDSSNPVANNVILVALNAKASVDSVDALYAELDEKADLSDAELSAVAFSDWEGMPNGYKLRFVSGQWEPYVTPEPGMELPAGVPKGDANSTSLTWTAGDEAAVDITATRHPIGYVLGSQTTKPLARFEDTTNVAATVVRLDANVATNTANIATLQAESSLVYRLYSGSNVVDEVTNYNSRVHAPTRRLLQLTASNTYVTVWTETNGLARTLAAASNYTDSAVSAATGSLPSTYAPRAWSRTTSGLGVDAPSNTTWISTPQTVFAGGLEFSKTLTTSGQLWFLTYNGQLAQVYTNQASNIGLTAADGTEIFAVEKTDSYLVGVAPDSIHVSGNTVTMNLSVVAESHPYVRYTPTLSPVAWENEEDGFTSPITVTWSGTSGAYVCTVTTTATQGFFAFEYVQEGGVKITNKGALDVSAEGILCTDGVHRVRPVYDNGSVTWEVMQ